MKPAAIGAILAALSAAVFVLPAAAGGLYADRVHADSFGNLVIHAPGGYKRIIVGQGEAAAGYNATGSYYETDLPKLADARSPLRLYRPYTECDYQAVLLKGRSYMYGLPDHVVPAPAYELCH